MPAREKKKLSRVDGNESQTGSVLVSFSASDDVSTGT